MSRTAAHLGQHFLHSPSAIGAMVESAGVSAENAVLEIGPGEGVLTEALLQTGASVVAIEKDSSLVERLKSRFAAQISSKQLTLIEDDFRNIKIPELMNTSYIVCANVPYYITGEIIRTLLTAEKQPSNMSLLIQKEVAQRIVARDKKESILSLSVKAYGVPTVARIVPRGSFRPAPSVDSAILAVNSISRDFFTGFSEEEFFSVVKSGFAEKRKQLGGNLKSLAGAESLASAFNKCEILPSTRAEDLSLPHWACLAKQLFPKD